MGPDSRHSKLKYGLPDDIIRAVIPEAEFILSWSNIMEIEGIRGYVELEETFAVNVALKLPKCLWFAAPRHQSLRLTWQFR
jgi:hypothetical protein